MEEILYQSVHNVKGKLAVQVSSFSAYQFCSHVLVFDKFRAHSYFLYARVDTIVSHPELFARWRRIGLCQVFQSHRRRTERGPGNTVSMEETFLMIQRFNWRYRFFKRELAALVQSDPQLKEQFVASHREHLATVRQAIDASIAQGFFVAIPDRQRELLTEQIWLMALFWLNYLEVGGEEVTEETLRRGNELLRNMMLPYLSPAALGSLAGAAMPGGS